MRSAQAHLSRRVCATGFTMVELVVAIVVGAIVIGMSIAMVGAPVDSYLAQSRRADLTDTADRTSRQLQSDFDNVLPNSVRVASSATTQVVQFLATSDIAYFAPGSGADDLLDLASDQKFYAFGSFLNGVPDNQYLAVNSTGTGLGDPYRVPSKVLVQVTAAEFGPVAGGARPITLTTPFTFNSAAVNGSQRLFVVSGPVTYVCNETAQTLRRFDRHLIAPTVPLDEADAQLNNAGARNGLVATGVTGCSITCGAGVAPCQRSIKIALTISRGTAPNIESVFILKEFGLDDRP